MPSPTLQLLSQTIYLTDGVTLDWNFSFAGGYLDASHVKAYYLDSVGNKTQVTSFTLPGAYQLHTNTVIPAGNRLYIYRDTPKTAPLVDFSDGSSLTEIALDTNAKQAVMIAAESADAVASSNIQDAINAATSAANSAAAASATSASVTANATASATAAVAASTASATASAVASAASATSAANNAASVSAVNTVATTAASAAASSASAAAVSADRSVAAWAASTAPAEQLASFSPSIHVGAIIKALIYDTSKDSDGGAWRKRMQDKSWYTEALGGDRWIGQRASIAAAWTAAGSTTGAVFQATATAGPLTSGKYYAATSATTATEVRRGISREFPAQVAIVAETLRVVIYDLTQAGCPMWLVFVGGDFVTGGALSFDQTTGSSANNISSATALNGVIYLAQGNSGNGQGLRIINFITDTADRTSDSARSNTWRFKGNISRRNNADSGYQYSSIGIVNLTANDIAITILDTAPIDPATGLPVPTIAIFTTSGVSVIKDDGTVASDTQTVNVVSGNIVGNDLYSQVSSSIGYTAVRRNFAAAIGSAADKFGLSTGGDALYRHNTIPALYQVPTNSAPVKAVKAAYGRDTGLSLLKENPATPTKGMVAYITNAYNSGWLPGDIRGAYLADTTAETITASGELVTNGTFTTDTSGWAGAVSTLSVVAGALRMTATGPLPVAVTASAIPTVVGRTYMVTATLVTANPTKNAFLYVGTNSGGSQLLNITMGSASGVVSVGYFTAASTTTYVSVNGSSGWLAGEAADFDNISVKLADPDRSVKNMGLVVNGTLTKAAVASGAGLVAYSGFSASNYLEQPINSLLDFGTGDFCLMGWVNYTAASSQVFFDRATAGAGRICLYASVDLLRYSCSATGVLASTGVAMPAGLSFIEMSRTAGVLNFSINGVRVFSTANTANVSNAAAKTVIGAAYDYTGGYPTFMALWRIGATAPSADQIAHIYCTELPLFQPGAQCTLAGTSTAVTALGYDDITDVLHVGTSWGRSAFRDMLRVDSEATTVGSIASLSANEGVVLTGGASSAKVYVPAMYLRDELRRKDIARKALGRIPQFFDYTATASQTAFVLPKGFTIKALYKNGTRMREATTGVYWTRSNDGFQETATLSVGATVSDWVSLMCVRN